MSELRHSRVKEGHVTTTGTALGAGVRTSGRSEGSALKPEVTTLVSQHLIL